MHKTFVEIGTCDFDTCIPLLKNGWQGIFVEPVKEYLDNIQKQAGPYASQAQFINKVVSAKDGEIAFAISKSGNDWTRGISHVIGSEFNHPKLLTLESNKGFLDRIINLPSISLDTLIETSGITQIDFLKLDTEGHEKEILENYSWSIKPTFIKLEHFHIDDIRMKKFLEDQGYIVWTENRDIYAIV